MKQVFGVLIIGALIFVNCKLEDKERFFTKHEFNNKLNQTVNREVLERIKNDSTIIEDEMVFSFYFITDTRSKIDLLIDFLEQYEHNQQIIELNSINEIWELNGRSYPIKLEIDIINKWERNLLEIGCKFDCKLDGWETTYTHKD